MNRENGKKTGKISIVRLVIIILIVSGVMYAFLNPDFLRARSSGEFTACQSNCKNIATALEMYAEDNGGEYPSRLAELTPEILKTVPTCASAGADTYSSSYESFNDSAADIHRFTFCCKGLNHKKYGRVKKPDYPRFDSEHGLQARPEK